MEFDGIPIGSIRFDIDGKEALLNYQLDAEYHGKGFGGVLLKKGIEWIINPSNINSKTIDVIIGDVIRENVSSIKTFERFGFGKKEQVENLRFEKWI
jgi:RimJ/RimL family protein N-acetyltransferase